MASTSYAPQPSYDTLYGAEDAANADPFAVEGGIPGTYPADTYSAETFCADSHAPDSYGGDSYAGDTYGGDMPDVDSHEAASQPVVAFGPEQNGPWDEWNPTEESIGPVRGRHRVAKQRSGGMARSGAVLGVGMMAAVGAGGMATAKDKSPASVAMPDLASLAGDVTEEVPGLGSVVADDEAPAQAEQAAFGGAGAGESLRTRILAQAAQQQAGAAEEARQEASAAAAQQAADESAKKAEAAREAEAERRREEARQRRLERLARSYTLPLTSYTITAGFGAGGSMWSNDHTGVDFAAQTGTPVMAVHSGTIKEAGWAGAYGYRIVLELDDGTEVWYCHLSSINVAVGAEVNTKDVIGNLGSTGNSTGPHLHLEVRPGGGDPVDPLTWLRGKGLDV